MRGNAQAITKKGINDMNKKPIGTIARTGEQCPESGVWMVLESISTTAPIAKGNTMVPYRAKAVAWKLVQYA